MSRENWYRASCHCANCGWTGRAVIQHGVEVRQVKCPRCEVKHGLVRVAWLWPWQLVLGERTAFRG